MSAINRRSMLLAGASILALSTGADAALFRSGAASASPGGTTSLTFANTSASNSPATTPLQIAKGFARGAVPAGFIAVPNISGTPLTYQADNRTYWDDGSLRHAVFRCLTGAINAGATVQVTFPISAGGYSNASPNTTADITGNSDYKIALTNVHTAQTALVSQLAVSLTMSGGVITGGKCWANDAGFNGTLNVANGNGSGGQVSISGTAVSVVSGGSGYSNVGTGSFNIGFNSIVAAVNSGGNHNGASLIQYAKGPVCDAWRARMAVSGAPHLHTTFYVERWKDGSGNFAYFRAYCVYGVGLVDTTATMYNYTYSLDWKNGSTVIRGTTNSDPGFTNNTVYMGGSATTFGSGTSGLNYIDSAKPDWSSNSATLNAIIPQPTATECDQIKASGLILPWLAIATNFPQPTVAKTYTTDGQDLNYINVYQPNAAAGIRNPLGSGGSGSTEAPMPQVNSLHWIWARQGNAANSNLWLSNSRVAAAHGIGSPSLGGGVYDPTTLYVPNIIPTSAHTFTGMTQNLSGHYADGDITQLGYMHPYIDGGGSLIDIDVYHMGFFLAYIYQLEGEQWALDAMLNQGTLENYCQYPSFHGQITLGPTTYYGSWAGYGSNERIPAWATMANCYAAAFSPTAWSDGATNIEQQYALYLAQQTAAYRNALVSFTGSVTIGSLGTPITKTVDYTGTGVLPDLFVGAPFGETEIEVPFMTDYTAMCFAFGGWLLQGTAAGAALLNYVNYFKQQFVGLYAYTGSHYLNDSYRINVLTGPASNSPASDPTWSSMGNVASPKLGVIASNSGGSNQLSFIMTNGSATMQLSQLSASVSTPDSMCVVGSTRAASGSRIKLSTSDTGTITPNWAAIPSGFDGVTWYYWKELTPTTGQLCSDSGLTTPVAPSGIGGSWTGYVTNNVLTITAVGSGALAVNQVISATDGINSLPAGTWITEFFSGTGGLGTYVLSSAPTPGTTIGSAGSPVSVTSNAVTNLCFWLCPANILPADNSGSGTYNSQGQNGGSTRPAVKYGTIAMMKRFGISDSPVSCTNAIANLGTILTAVNGSIPLTYETTTLYAWDSAA